MTAEADEVLDEVEPGTLYLIGGMVDRNRLPGICHERAQKFNLKARRIPIRENIKERFLIGSIPISPIIGASHWLKIDCQSELL